MAFPIVNDSMGNTNFLFGEEYFAHPCQNFVSVTLLMFGLYKRRHFFTSVRPTSCLNVSQLSEDKNTFIGQLYTE